MKKETPEEIFEKYRCTLEEALAMEPMAFANKYLFPFMRREAGRGFAMCDWTVTAAPASKTLILDGIRRKTPACGTAACIGGSMEIILGTGNRRILGAVLGLPEAAAYALFFEWGTYAKHNCWPHDLAVQFMEAKNPAAKERVAEEVIVRAIRTGGLCFKPFFRIPSNLA